MRIKRLLLMSVLAITLIIGVNVPVQNGSQISTPTAIESSNVIVLADSYPYPTNPPYPGYEMGTWLVNTYDYNVEQLQYRLTSLGYSTNGVDGYYGNNTANAVWNYQYWNGLTVDGICGQQTWNDIFN